MSEQIKELNHELTEEKDKLRKMRFDLSMSQLDDTSAIKKTKKKIAQINTKINALSTSAEDKS